MLPKSQREGSSSNCVSLAAVVGLVNMTSFGWEVTADHRQSRQVLHDDDAMSSRPAGSATNPYGTVQKGLHGVVVHGMHKED